MFFGRRIEVQRLLHDAFLKQAEASPEASALICGDRALTYGELRRCAEGVAARLGCGVRSSAPVAVVMETGWEPIAAALGVMMAGAAWAPIDLVAVGDDLGRRLDDAGADVVVTQTRLVGARDFGRKRRVVPIDRGLAAEPPAGGSGVGAVAAAKAKGLGCVLFRRDPRGGRRRVKVTHAQLGEALAYFGKHARIDGHDRALSLDPFDSEAFICCAFSTLAAGGTVVVPLESEARDPLRWLELIADYDITALSSSPQTAQTLLATGALHPAFSLASLRLAILDGAWWMPVRLPTEMERVAPGARIVAFHADLGDASDLGRRIELLDPVWISGLFRQGPVAGKDAGHRFHVLSPGLDDCAPLVLGDLYVGSPSSPSGRWPSTYSFRTGSVRHPRSGSSLVRTGYRARLRPDGGIEFSPWLDRKTFAVSPTPSVWWDRARA